MWQSVECPQLKNAKRLCIALLVACAACGYFHIHIGWPIAFVIMAFVAVMAIRAGLIQQQYNDKPWDHGGKECDFSEKGQ